MSKRTVCFYAKVEDHATLELNELYAVDIRILRDLEFDVHVALRPWQLRPADLYYAWWWTWGFFPVVYANMLRRPVVVCGVFDISVFQARPWWERKMIHHAMKHADANIFISDYEFTRVPKLCAVKQPHHVPLVANTELYRPIGDHRENMVLSVSWLQGTNPDRKGIPQVIQAAPLVRQRVPNTRFVIAGRHGTAYERLKNLAAEVGAADYVEFPGHISCDEKIRLMQQCKVYAQPTQREGFGLATLEAMSCGAAVLTSPGEAVPEVVGDTAVLVDHTSIEQIADGISRCLENDQFRSDLGSRARKRAVELFSYERRKQELAAIFETLLSQRQS
jgi:glycosyltransferase involved in cell wall biosynthesis